MMKVICINCKGGYDPNVPVPEIGSEYTVINTIYLIYHGRPLRYYILSELGENNAYACFMFAPTDGPDEREMTQERQREMAERMDRSWKVIEAHISKTEPA